MLSSFQMVALGRVQRFLRYITICFNVMNKNIQSTFSKFFRENAVQFMLNLRTLDPWIMIWRLMK